MTDRRHALTFNALTQALATADRFVPLSVREQATRAILNAINSTGTCDASMPGVGAEPVGPCVLRYGHDGPVHQAANGAKWWPTDAVTDPGTENR